MTQTKKSPAKKSAITNVIKNADANKKIVNLNLEQFASKLKDVTIKEKKDKETLYVYPEILTKDEINGEKGKKFRNKLRQKMQKFENNIFYFAKIQSADELQKCIVDFDAFYKENYRINDYSLKSISSSNDEKKNADLKTMLEIINAVKSAK